MKVGDYFQHRQRWWLRLHEKGGKRHEVPCHPQLEAHLQAWITAAGIARDKKGQLFRSVGKGERLGAKAMSRFDMIPQILELRDNFQTPAASCRCW
jgi:integrase/recombinase XerD